MNNKHRIYAILAVFIVLITSIFPTFIISASALASNYYTGEGYLIGSRPYFDGEWAYSVTGGGNDSYAYRSGFNDLCAYNNVYTLEGKCLVRGGIESYVVDIYQTDYAGNYVLLTSKTAFTFETGSWYSFSSLQNSAYEEISGIEDVNNCGMYTFNIDISNYVADQGRRLKFVVTAYVSPRGPDYKVCEVSDISALSTNGNGGGNTDNPVPPTENNWFTSVTRLDCKDGVKIASNQVNTTFTTDLAVRYEPNPTTFDDGTMSIVGWCCVPYGTQYYTIDIFDPVTGKYITLDTREQGVAFNAQMENTTDDIRNYVTSHGGSTGDYWLNGKYVFNIDFSKLPVNFDDVLVTIRIHSISNNGQINYDLAILSNFYVEFQAEEPPTKPIVNNDNIFNGTTTTVIFKEKDNTEYKVTYSYNEYLFNERSMLNVGDLVYLAYTDLGISAIEQDIKLVTVYLDFPRSYRWRDYNIFVNATNLIGNDYGQLMGFYALEPNGLYYTIHQDIYDLLADNDGNRFTRIQLTTVGGSTFSQMVSPFYADTEDGIYELHIGSSRDVNWFNLFSGMYDAQLEAFYGITNFTIFGYNFSTLLLGLLTLVIVVVIVKKVI